ncbi:MAG: glycerol-3-phosphate acyltransferase [Eubacteriaceae bacterium]|nr:glycerol-3-phosphate acyltransferase [Eubacteriaceae bacterium]
MIRKLIGCALMSYFIGSINPSQILGKMHGHDMRKEGSKNAGASNAYILIGKSAFFIVAASDIFKAWLCWKLTAYFVPEAVFSGVFGGFFCTLGHMFPVFMGFHGGKGFACLGGMIMGFSPWLFIIQLGIALAVFFLLKYLVFATIFSSALFTGIYWYFTRDITGTGILALMTVMISLKHRENFKRMKEGKEATSRYLGHADEELKRMGYK